MTTDTVRGTTRGDAPRLTDERAAVARRLVQSMAGPEAELREDQATAVAALAEAGARVLVVQATGWGKSAVYWAATAVRRAEGAGPTLVVSPLLSLMRDQVAAAGRAGLRAATLNSGNVDDWQAIESSLRDGDIDVLLVSPERLANPTFGARVLDGLSGRLGLVVIDEAHAVSDWGHDFRPDYRRVSDVLQRLDPGTPVLATTATANARVTEDVAAQLGEATLVLRGPLARRSLALAVVDSLSPLERYAWVVDHLPRLPGAGIVYALTVADAHRLADVLTAAHGEELRVAAYTGQLSADERARLEDDLRENRLKALVATSALGMGYDKPDLGFVVHLGSPPSPVSYYQQVGRAGRAIDHAVAVLLPSGADSGVWDWFATASIPREEEVRRVLAELPRDPDAAMSVPALEAQAGVRRTRVELLLKQLAVEGVTERLPGGWVATGEPWAYDAEHYDGVLATRRREADLMRDYVAGRRCLMQVLQESLDDPAAEPCGRCSVCREALPDGLSSQASTETVARVTGALRGEVSEVEPRKMWPGGEFGTRGRIDPGEMVEVGRALIDRDAPQWREEVATMERGDAEVAPAVAEGAVRLLGQWKSSWRGRPEVVVDLPAAGRSRLVRSLADHLAEVGGLGRAGLAVAEPLLDTRETSSGAEAAHWQAQVRQNPPPEVAGRRVLLLVDATSSLWPVTVAGAMLRQAGASAVMPLVVHRRP
ncbi:DEAD/DEAH box helicase [Nocardioidaceae bacterium]|nr:DEAD/DEAH box helicase [Nocardioidaceae bacterium]